MVEVSGDVTEEGRGHLSVPTWAETELVWTKLVINSRHQEALGEFRKNGTEGDGTITGDVVRVKGIRLFQDWHDGTQPEVNGRN